MHAGWSPGNKVVITMELEMIFEYFLKCSTYIISFNSNNSNIESIITPPYRGEKEVHKNLEDLSEIILLKVATWNMN